MIDWLKISTAPDDSTEPLETTEPEEKFFCCFLCVFLHIYSYFYYYLHELPLYLLLQKSKFQRHTVLCKIKLCK